MQFIAKKNTKWSILYSFLGENYFFVLAPRFNGEHRLMEAASMAFFHDNILVNLRQYLIQTFIADVGKPVFNQRTFSFISLLEDLAWHCKTVCKCIFHFISFQTFIYTRKATEVSLIYRHVECTYRNRHKKSLNSAMEGRISSFKANDIGDNRCYYHSKK